MLPPTPVDARQTSALSDTHMLDSQPLILARALRVLCRAPSPAPDRVTLCDPVANTFDLPRTLREAASEDITSVTLPTGNPKVTPTRRLPLKPWPPLLTIEVSESHSLLSQLLAPRRTAPLSALIPRPEPRTVRLDDPDDPAFIALNPLTLDEDTEKTDVELPTESPTLTIARCVCLAAYPTRHRKPVSEPHAVLSQAVRPKRTDGDTIHCPNMLPNTVKLRDPDEGEFANKAPPVPSSGVNRIGTSTLDIPLTLPLIPPTDTDTALEASNPTPLRHLAPVSEIHSLSSHLLNPTETRKLDANIPRFKP